MQKILATVFISLLVAPGGFAQERSVATDTTGRIKAALAQMALGQDTRLAVRLRDKSVVTGYLDGVSAYSFFVTDPATGISVQVPYRNVTHLALSNKAKLAATAGVLGAALLLFMWLTVVQGGL
jgi:hypothetical protein